MTRIISNISLKFISNGLDFTTDLRRLKCLNGDSTTSTRYRICYDLWTQTTQSSKLIFNNVIFNDLKITSKTTNHTATKLELVWSCAAHFELTHKWTSKNVVTFLPWKARGRLELVIPKMLFFSMSLILNISLNINISFVLVRFRHWLRKVSKKMFWNRSLIDLDLWPISTSF